MKVLNGISFRYAIRQGPTTNTFVRVFPPAMFRVVVAPLKHYFHFQFIRFLCYCGALFRKVLIVVPMDWLQSENVWAIMSFYKAAIVIEILSGATAHRIARTVACAILIYEAVCLKVIAVFHVPLASGVYPK